MAPTFFCVMTPTFKHENMNELILYPSLNKLLCIYDLRVFCFCFLSVTEFGLARIILLKIGVLVL